MLDDGMWYEGSFGYHTFTLSAYMPLFEALYNTGTNLYEIEVCEQVLCDFHLDYLEVIIL